MYMYTPHHHSAFDVAEDQTLGRRRRRGETGRRDQWLQSGTVPSTVLRGATPARTDGRTGVLRGATGATCRADLGEIGFERTKQCNHLWGSKTGDCAFASNIKVISSHCGHQNFC